MSDTLRDSIVKDYYIGKTHILISDLYCRDRTDEEVRAILRRIARRAQETIGEAAQRSGKQGAT